MSGFYSEKIGPRIRQMHGDDEGIEIQLRFHDLFWNTISSVWMDGMMAIFFNLNTVVYMQICMITVD